MRFIALADHVRITDGHGRVYTCDTFGLEVDWQVQGDLAAVEAEFTTDTAVKKIPTCGTAAAGGDFNSDFNNDFSSAGEAYQGGNRYIYGIITTITKIQTCNGKL